MWLSAVAAGKATKTIPIVLLAVNDPVGVGLVKNLERPGTNVTGTTLYAPQLIGERLRMLQSIVASLDKVAMALNGTMRTTLPSLIAAFRSACSRHRSSAVGYP